MNLFGCKFCKIEEISYGKQVKRCERKNFDTLLWALITVFQVRLRHFVVTFALFYCSFVFHVKNLLFSTLGMVLFGGKFCNHVITGEQCTCEERAKTPELCDCDRTNYDCFLNAVVTVFQVLFFIVSILKNFIIFIFIDSYSRRLEYGAVQRNESDHSMGSSLFCCIDDFWKLRFVQLAGRYFG